MRRGWILCAAITVLALGVEACGSEADGPGGTASGGTAGGVAAGADAGWAGQGGSSGSGAGSGGGVAAGGGVDAGGVDAAVPKCGCFFGDGPYCSGRAKAEADKDGCSLPAVVGTGAKLLKCVNDKWSVSEDCPGKCLYDASSKKLDDACELPVCNCFVQVAWCGSGVSKEADKRGCRVPLLPAQHSNILYCPGGKWTVKEKCDLGCVEAPSGTPDYCKTKNDYKMPYDCGSTRTCSNGNNTGTHTGKDQYAYDFPMPPGTNVRAMRGGKVHQVRYVSKPGSACYNSGSSSCANYANTVEVLHSDGTVGLYMHLSQPTVSAGQTVGQGAVLGKSGNSGWSTGAHTHVQVQKNCGIWWCQSIPFKFTEDSSISAGTSVKSQNCP
jgi:hypothetical protein